MSKQSKDCKEAGRLQSPDSTYIRWVKQLSEDLFTMLIAGLWDYECFSHPSDCNKFGVSRSSKAVTTVLLIDMILVWCYAISTVDSYHDFRWSECLVLQGQSVHVDDSRTLLYHCLTLKMKALYTCKMSVTVYNLTQHNIPEDLDLRQHCPENLKSHKQQPPLGLVL
jgi:hypothetical protein